MGASDSEIKGLKCHPAYESHPGSWWVRLSWQHNGNSQRAAGGYELVACEPPPSLALLKAGDAAMCVRVYVPRNVRGSWFSPYAKAQIPPSGRRRNIQASSARQGRKQGERP